MEWKSEVKIGWWEHVMRWKDRNLQGARKGTLAILVLIVGVAVVSASVQVWRYVHKLQMAVPLPPVTIPAADPPKAPATTPSSQPGPKPKAAPKKSPSVKGRATPTPQPSKPPFVWPGDERVRG